MASGIIPVWAEPCHSWKEEFKNKSDLVVGDIVINAANVFDLSKSAESRAIHNFANNIHISTKPKVIRRQLLFKQGEHFQPRKLVESQRLIRSNRYIKDVDISPYELCGKHVNIRVNTRDKWTLAPGLSFSQSGGNSRSGFEIQEHNLIGLGKGLVLGFKSKEERDETVLSYTDPQLFGSKQQLFISTQNNSDGNGHILDLSLPFFERDSRKAWGIKTSSLTEENSLYDKGDVSDKIKVKKVEHSAFKGWSKGLKNDVVSRFKVGWKYKESDYKDNFSTIESYPWFEYERKHESFTTRINFKTMGEVEDITLGTNYKIGFGLLRKEFGSTDNHLNLSAAFEKGYEFSNSLGFINMSANSYLGKGRLKGESLDLTAEWYSFSKHGSDVYLSGKFKYQNNLQPDEQILLGGDTGLRAYPKGYQQGDKSLVFTAEKRIHFDWYPLHLAKFGAVVFTDIGSAWKENEDPELLADIGLGLRLISTHSSITKAVHFDIAFPLNSDKDDDNFQLTIKTKKSF